MLWKVCHVDQDIFRNPKCSKSPQKFANQNRCNRYILVTTQHELRQFVKTQSVRHRVLKMCVNAMYDFSPNSEASGIFTSKVKEELKICVLERACWCCRLSLHGAWGYCCHSGVCALVLAYRCRCRVSLQAVGALRALLFGVAFAFRMWPAGAATRCRWSVLLEGAAVTVVRALWSWHFGAAAGYCCRVLLDGAAVWVACAFWCWPTGAAAGYRCRMRGVWGRCFLELRLRFGGGLLVLLQGAAGRCYLRALLLVVYALWSWHVGATARCRCSVPLQGCCQSAVCTLELACCCRCRVCKEWCILVQGVAARFLWQSAWPWQMEIAFMP